MYLNDYLYICMSIYIYTYTYLDRQSCRFFFATFEFHITLVLFPWYNIFYDHCHLDISLSHSGYPSTNHHHRPATAAIFLVVQWYSAPVAGCLAGLLAGWLACFLAGWLACWLAGLLAGWLACWLAGLLACLLAGLLPCLLACWLAGLLACWFAGWLAGWLAGLLACWLAGLLACWLACLLASLLACLLCWLAPLLACLLAGLLPCLLAGSRLCFLACLLPCFPGTPVCENLAEKKSPGKGKKFPVKIGYQFFWRKSSPVTQHGNEKSFILFVSPSFPFNFFAKKHVYFAILFSRGHPH